MNLNNIREGELRDAFNALEDAFTATNTDYYIIGALAKDVWYSRGNKTMRQTRDVDFAVLVGSKQDYESIRNYLRKNSNFATTKENDFVMLAPSGVQVDILPFGEIEIDDGVHIDGAGLTNIKVNGFMEVYQGGTSEVKMHTGHAFKVATLPSIILLKLIAYDDRPEHRSKDARDIAGIVTHFFDLQADLIYDNHADLFTDEKDERALEEISAIVIGREIRKICALNEPLMERLMSILQTHIELAEESTFIRNMVAENQKTVEDNVQLLKNIFGALRNN